MVLKLITDRNEINQFVITQTHSQFLHSYEWAKVQKQAGNSTEYFGLYDSEKLLAIILLITKKLPLGLKYWYSPRGPICVNASYLDPLLLNLKGVAREENISFLRFEPTFKIKNTKSDLVKTIHVQPEMTVILDLKYSEGDLLKKMHQKTRYNIRLAEKRGVKIREAREGDFDKWWQIMEETKARDQFRLHSRSHYKNILLQDNFKLIIAEHDGEVIAGNIEASFGDTVTYVHGGSSNIRRNVMAPYGLQWYSIKKAKEKGCSYYDFYGIDEEKWPGVTRFKRGFGGEEIKYPGTFDLIFNSGKYRIYKILRQIRRLI